MPSPEMINQDEQSGEEEGTSSAPDFDYQPIYSTHVDQVAFNKGELRVIFNDGAEWAYYNVSDRDYKELLGIGSVGKYMNSVIKKKYRAQKLT